MKIQSRWLTEAAGFLGATFISQWMGTLDYRVAFYDPTVDPVNSECHSRKIYIFWHEFIFFPIYLRGNCNISILLSRHRDADILTRAASHLGFDFVRGSSSRGGATALRELARKSRTTHLGITPDGPVGPRRQLALGPVYLASRLKMPLVLMGFGHDRPWRTKSWDRFAIPRPFSRARGVLSSPIHVPANANRDVLEHYRVQSEATMNRLTLEAEAWAESGTHKIMEQSMVREPAPKSRSRNDSQHLLRAPHFMDRDSPESHSTADLAGNKTSGNAA